jgi:transmembrane sensor
MSQYDFDILLKKYLEGNCSSHEESIVLKWYQNLISESRLELTKEEKQAIENKIWAKVHSGINTYPGKTRKAPVLKFNPKISYRVAVAACVVLLVGTGWYWLAKSPFLLSKMPEQVAISKIPNNYSRVSNEDEHEKNVLLSDGSLITLQPKSTLYYPSTFTGNTREVYLTGNAFFKIFHNPVKHFIVHTGGLLTEVLGTSFNITHDPKTNKIEIAVVTGKVSVYEQSKMDNVAADLQPNSVILTPNQKVTYNSVNNQFITSLVEDPKPLESAKPIDTTGRFVFEEAPLSKVLNELSEVYGIDINTETKNLDNCHFTGDITRQDLYKKLDIICQSTRSSYEVKGTEIIIKGKGCN